MNSKGKNASWKSVFVDSAAEKNLEYALIFPSSSNEESMSVYWFCISIRYLQKTVMFCRTFMQSVTRTGGNYLGKTDSLPIQIWHNSQGRIVKQYNFFSAYSALDFKEHGLFWGKVRYELLQYIIIPRNSKCSNEYLGGGISIALNTFCSSLNPPLINRKS